jgi:choline dehydrogenase-like flavoprotein
VYRSGPEVPEGSALRAAVCVVGSGPAALTVAAELAAAKQDVVLVESGGRDFDPAAQELSRATMSASTLVDVVANRRRQIGGNANVWLIKMVNRELGVRLAPLDPVDFQARPGQPRSGWPFERDTLRSNYEAAQRICQAGPFDYSPPAWSGRTTGPWALDADRVESKVFQFGPRAAFHRHLADQVAAAPTVTVVHDATAVELATTASDGPITGLRCRTLRGNGFSVEAGRYVLAAGGLANPHLLLASNAVRPAGLGNEHDLVGRYLQDHPLLAGGSLELFDSETWNRSTFYDMRDVGGHSGLGYLALSPTAILAHGLGGLSATLFPRPSARRSRTMEALRDYVDAARHRHLGRDQLRQLPQLVLGLDYLPLALARKLCWDQSLYHGFGRGGWSTMPRLPARFRRWEVVPPAEQSPEPENRVTLTRARDAVGLPVLDVHWRWSEADAERAGRGRRLLAEELARAGIGRLVVPPDDDRPGLGLGGGTAHYMGTTRMHADPCRGVVDPDGRVHSLPNLYLTGSSVFPTSGYANPTLTIVALAHRLGRHLATHG